MTDLLLILNLLAVIGIGAMVWMILRRKGGVDLSPLEQSLANLQHSGERTERTLREEMARSRQELSAATGQLREEVLGILTRLGQTLTTQLTTQSEASDQRLDRLRTAVDTQLKAIQADSGNRLDQMRQQSTEAGQTVRNEVAAALKSFSESLVQSLTSHATTQHQQMEGFSLQLSRLISSNEQKLEAMRQAVEAKLTSLQADNAKQLEQMRQTVDEKLQSTLDQRLGESFKQVSERLEAVYKGLGEMQSLATGVGDLKRVLTNVRTRGTWGEIQLGAMLEQVLLPDQYVANFQSHDGGEFVEFAIKLPGRADDSDQPIFLPIDAKFPTEDYQRLTDAQEQGNLEAAEEAGRLLEIRIKACAQEICDKYIRPPKTTDFAILFLPTEGLFAEVVRRAGLSEFIQQKCRVVIAGPTTLWAVLNSFQMGFRTLAIQQRSSEVWNLLSSVKSEWSKYQDILAKVQKKLTEASNVVGQAEQRTRVIGRKLKDVQQLPAEELIDNPLLLDQVGETEE